MDRSTAGKKPRASQPSKGKAKASPLTAGKGSRLNESGKYDSHDDSFYRAFRKALRDRDKFPNGPSVPLFLGFLRTMESYDFNNMTRAMRKNWDDFAQRCPIASMILLQAAQDSIMTDGGHFIIPKRIEGVAYTNKCKLIVDFSKPTKTKTKAGLSGPIKHQARRKPAYSQADLKSNCEQADEPGPHGSRAYPTSSQPKADEYEVEKYESDLPQTDEPEPHGTREYSAFSQSEADESEVDEYESDLSEADKPELYNTSGGFTTFQSMTVRENDYRGEPKSKAHKRKVPLNQGTEEEIEPQRRPKLARYSPPSLEPDDELEMQAIFDRMQTRIQAMESQESQEEEL
ncbi:uncharacterized protein GGS22DRAFT_196846 [Annulohypoxylon maeteangense]|uniref:uncharacterized protein n=1 Tax=Annulohypoxylon maeteangense TaxID=1927788 RepID=UPI0020073F85|nr:uncharacterized protein GGS22DRAFT_196846 [Annulohypoxylon maeteangense]KAI0889214.1 hypothetical protein GGS22DRAFT_196846 [Annulohypoxylon maeteangense]